MKKFGIATIAATGFAAALIGLAVPAQATVATAPTGLTSVEFSAGIDRHQWIYDLQPKVKAPRAPIVGNGR